MKNSLVSIIIPIYNAEKTLDKCLGSLKEQTYKNIEVLMIDDGSKDNSSKICKNFEKIDNRFIYIYKNNSGVSASRNIGLDKSKGKYIFFLDSDDFLEKISIESLIKNSKPDVLCVLNYNIITNSYVESSYKKSQIISKEDYILDIINGKKMGVIWGYLFDKEKISMNRFNEDTFYLEDTLFLFKILKDNYNDIYIIEDTFYNYYINDNSITNKKGNLLLKCNSFSISLNEINQLFDYKYDKEIENKKIRLMEEILRFSSKKEIENVSSAVHLNKYKGKSIVYIFYSFLYRKKMSSLLCLYYKVRRLVKKMLKGNEL